MSFQALQYLKTSYIGHLKIQYDSIRLLCTGLCNTFRSSRAFRDLNGGIFKLLVDHVAVALIVIDEQDVHKGRPARQGVQPLNQNGAFKWFEKIVRRTEMKALGLVFHIACDEKRNIFGARVLSQPRQECPRVFGSQNDVQDNNGGERST